MTRKEKKGTTKRQHFVPQCLLRRFTKTERTTSVFVIGAATFVETAGIRTQCAADYYYGHDQTIENELSQLEGAFSKALGDMSTDTIERMGADDMSIVRAFVHVQAERTPLAGELVRGAYANLGEQMYSAFAKTNGLTAEDAVEQGRRFAEHQMPIPGAHTVKLASQFQSSIADLEVKFVQAEGFLISDHPALSLNLWRDEHPRFANWPSLGGLASKGFMYMMPVATDRLIVIYDADTYQVGKHGSRTVNASIGDVIALNALQTINASQLLFDSTVIKPIDVAAALHFRNQIRKTHGAGPLPLRPAGIPLSFLRTVDHEAYVGWDLAMLPTRPRAQLSVPPRPKGTKHTEP